jgi:hypothetical protein
MVDELLYEIPDPRFIPESGMSGDSGDRTKIPGIPGLVRKPGIAGITQP